MNINIAFNTIIYIMVFLFPGVLFRKFYYAGKHKNQFNHGNLFERFLITILTSIACIFFYALFFEFFLNDFLGIRIINQIQYCEFFELFQSLSNNRMPFFFEEKEKFKDFSLLFVAIYLFAGVTGFVLYKIVDITKLDRYFSFLRFVNEWEYLFHAPSKELKKKKSSKILSVSIDILTKTKNQEVLYQGDLYKILYNKDNEFESIAIRNVHKFLDIDHRDEGGLKKIADIEESITKRDLRYSSYRKYSNKSIYKRAINSDIFIINKTEIVNYNIVYLTKDKTEYRNKVKNIFGIIMFFILLLSVITCLILPFIIIENKYFDTIFKRIIFSVYSLIQLTIIFGASYNIVAKKEVYQKISNGFLIAFFGLFYLWFFEVLNWYIILFIGIIMIGIIGKMNRK